MNTKTDNSKLILVGVLAFSAILLAGRLAMHTANFTPTIALALVAGYVFRNKAWAILAILVGMIVSDFFIGFDSLTMRVLIYSSLFLSIGLGSFLPKPSSEPSLKSEGIFAMLAAGSTLLGALLFFLVTNAGVWFWSGMYMHTLEGLGQSYINGIPFFRSNMLASLLFGGLFFAATRTLQTLVLAKPSLKTSKAYK